MKSYRTSLKRRQRHSAQIVQRYWSDPEYRLACINADRARRGVPPRRSLDEVPPRGSWLRKAEA